MNRAGKCLQSKMIKEAETRTSSGQIVELYSFISLLILYFKSVFKKIKLFYFILL